VRTVALSAAELRAGANEICVFSPDGAMPEITVS
jgi:hypothetical protein